MLGTALTAIIGVVAKGKAAKAIAAGVGGLALTAGQPIVDTLVSGFSAGVMPSIEQLGLVLGQAVGGFIVGYAITWFAPKNAPAK